MGTARVIGGGALLAAGALHAVVVAPHLADDALSGAFFLLVQIVQLGTGLVALATVGRIGRWSLVGGGAFSLGVLLVYVASRTIGLPVGPQEPPTVGVVDAAAAILELAAGWAALVAVRHPVGRAPPARIATIVGTSAIVLLTVYAIAVDRGHDPDTRAEASATPEGQTPIGEPPGSVDADVVASVTATSAVFGASEPFRPQTVEVTAGADAVIRFTNADADARHNLSLYEPGSRGAPLFVGRIAAPGESFDLPFTSPEEGRYALRCDLHPWMQATLVAGS